MYRTSRIVVAALALTAMSVCGGCEGAAGDTGAKGDTGVAGDKGDKGDPGAKGDKGDPGAKGDKGDPGAKGDKGDPGAKGDKGDPGAKGDQGAKGAGGDSGAKGAKGDPGKDGTSGLVSKLPPQFAGVNIVAVHNPYSAGYLADQHGACIACHGDKTSVPTLKTTVANAHHQMFKVDPYAKLVGNARCVSCHLKDAAGDWMAVDVISAKGVGTGSGATLRKQVDVRRCVKCHCKGTKIKYYMACK